MPVFYAKIEVHLVNTFLPFWPSDRAMKLASRLFLRLIDKRMAKCDASGRKHSVFPQYPDVTPAILLASIPAAIGYSAAPTVDGGTCYENAVTTELYRCRQMFCLERS